MSTPRVQNECRISPRNCAWPALVAAFIFYASSCSRVAGPPIVNVDKYGHFLVYGLLATLLCRLGHGWRAAGWAVLAASFYGATDEWHQLFTPGRSCDVFDWLADTTGAALAAGLYTGWGFYRRLLEAELWRRAAGVESGAAAGKVLER